MTDRDYYPAGAYDDPNAPWNEIEIPEKKFEVSVCQTLSKNTNVTTNSYFPEYDEEDGCMYPDTSDTNWKEAYENEHLTPKQLIEQFKEMLSTHLPDPIVDPKRYKRFRYLIEECENWEEDETEVVED